MILTMDPQKIARSWAAKYFPELVAPEMARYPPNDRVVRALGGTCRVMQVPIPLICHGFMEAYYGRPQLLLEPPIRQAQPLWGLLKPGMEETLVGRLRAALESGEWDREHGHLRTQGEYLGSITLIVSEAE